MGLIATMLGGGVALWWLFRWLGDEDRKPRWPADLPAPIEVWLTDDDGIDVGGTRIDLATLTSIARTAGVVDVHIARDTRRTWIESVSGALLVAGVSVRLLVQR